MFMVIGLFLYFDAVSGPRVNATRGPIYQSKEECKLMAARLKPMVNRRIQGGLAGDLNSFSYICLEVDPRSNPLVINGGR